MSIADEITRLQNAKANVKSQVNADAEVINKSIAFIDNETVDDYDDLIEDMQDAYKKYIPVNTGSGTEIQIDNSNNDKAITSIGLDGNTEQTTYTGKNLFDKDHANILSNCVTGSAPALEAVEGCKTLYISCKSSTTYTVSKIASTRFIVVTTDTTPAVGVGTSTRNIDLTGTQITITTGASAKYICVFYYYSASDTLTEQQILDSIQIEQGSTATTYEKYVGGTASPNPDYPQEVKVVTGENIITISNSDNTESQSYPINLGSLELAKISTYKDKIYNDDNDKKWYFRQEAKKELQKGTESWTLNSSTSDYYEFARWGLSPVAVSGYVNAITDYFSNQTNNRCITNGQAVYIRVPVSAGITTASAFETWLTTHNVTMWYALATPIVTEITDTNLINQLEAVKLLSGTQNNFSIDADTLPTLNLNYIGEANPHL